MHFTSIHDVSRDQVARIYQSVPRFRTRRTDPVLADRHIGLVFEKQSTRTRVSFEVGIRQLGAHPVMMTAADMQLSRGESARDTALVLSRYLDGLILRVNRHDTVQEFARTATVPVINALSNEEHPCQALSDVYTVMQARKLSSVDELRKIKFVYIGDGNNVCVSLMYIAEMLEMPAVFIVPKRFRPSVTAAVTVTDDLAAVDGAEVLYTDVWVSMGQEAERELRIQEFARYQVNESLLARARPGAIIMHCLPAKRGLEITDAVLDGPQSVVLDQAENRLYVQKALLAFLYGGA
jgi:ornithine carbamoyltransferase